MRESPPSRQASRTGTTRLSLRLASGEARPGPLGGNTPASRRPLISRLAHGIGRRVQYRWSKLVTRQLNRPAAAAVSWLTRHSESKLPLETSGATLAESAECMATLARFGQWHAVDPVLHRLLSNQQEHGGWGDSPSERHNFVLTSRILAALPCCIDRDRRVHSAVERGVDHLVQFLDGDGGVSFAPSLNSFDPQGPHHLPGELLIQSAFYRAGQALGDSRMMRRAQDAFRRSFNHADLFSFRKSMESVAQSIHALAELGKEDLAGLMARAAASNFARGNLLFTRLALRRMPLPSAAALASAFYRTGLRDVADLLMLLLKSRQAADGGFCVARKSDRVETLPADWGAVRLFLEASHWQVCSAFEQETDPLPAEIELADGRLQAVRRFVAGLPRNARVADVGCGNGRFLKVLAREFPQVSWVGIDPVPGMISNLPESIDFRRGSILSLPARDGEFDGVFAVESLEHSLLPEHALRELCRVVRPSGKVLVIDKERSFFALSQHQPWEIWFTPEEVCGPLGEYCPQVTVKPIALHPGQQPDGLFLAWEGTRGATRPQAGAMAA